MKLINLTPHDINYYLEDGSQIVFPSEWGLRLPNELIKSEPIQTEFGEIETVKQRIRIDKCKLPSQYDGIMYIVSTMVRLNFKHRKDLLSPSTAPQHAVRDENGNIIGVRKFVRN